MTNVERKLQGLPYRYDDPSLLGDQHSYQDKMIEYNRTLATETERRQELLREVFAEVGDDCTVETPLNANWGCRHVHLGKGIYINSNVTFVDDEHIYFADSAKWDDIAFLAFYELDKDFLKLLEKRKHALECEFANM